MPLLTTPTSNGLLEVTAKADKAEASMAALGFLDFRVAAGVLLTLFTGQAVPHALHCAR